MCGESCYPTWARIGEQAPLQIGSGENCPPDERLRLTDRHRLYHVVYVSPIHSAQISSDSCVVFHIPRKRQKPYFKF